MSDLGQLLRKARTERGITLEELQEGTKIRKRYLEAIEEGKYDILPGNFYARAFIKQYSEAVGLDADEVLRLYANEIPATEPEQSAEPIRMKRRPVNAPERTSRWASVVLMIAFPLLILGVIYYFSLNGLQPKDNVMDDTPLTDQRESEQGAGDGPMAGGDGEEGNATPDSEPVTPDPETQTPDPEPEADVAFVEKFRVKGAEAERFEVKNASTIKVEMKTIGSECWVGIMKDSYKSGDYVYQKRLIKDETYSAEFDHNIYINIGRANAMELKINGVVIDLGTEPDPRKYQFELTSS
ncbi:helix-turn-helix domain-containing protein [Paenibacillus alkalitolerans]|uniref:helix-turn-helix domain-containing protein n=1 Tax=Paenibacillus alkalitolerans TaxID=2799335 RepID=UPI0018F282A6|nr:RodZ domain-containing protein [Paenibacillus alkalitolerans]